MRGATDCVKRRSIFDFHRQNVDVLIMLETHSTPQCEKIWEAEWGGKIIFAHGTSAAKGTAILLKKNSVLKITNIVRCIEGRYIIIDVEENNVQVTLAAIYAPNQDTPMFFTNLASLIRRRQEKKIIIGDFNLTLNVELDRKDTYSNNNKAKEEVENLMDEFHMRDVWRIHHGEKREYSWWKKGNITKASRIDFALVSGGLDQKVELVQYLSSIKTDHRAIYMVIDINYIERGTGFWKFNTSLLEKADFIEKINEELEQTLVATEQKQPIERWEIVKSRVKKKAREYAKNSTLESKLVIAQLSEKVNEYEANLPLPEGEDKLWQDTKIELEEKLLEKVRGNIFRSKVKWYEEGEKNTKYFFALEKAKYNAKTCFKIIQDDQEIDNPHEILKVQRNFYKELYSEDRDVKFTLNNSLGIKIPQEIKQQQEIPIRMEDLECAIKSMQNGKTPGSDGIPVEFYKVFWTRIKPIFLDMVEETYRNGILHNTAREGILNLIPKPGKDSRIIKNLRPITLLNTDYKIIEKTIANMMMPALEHIIHKDQRGFMKNRRISVNIRKMLDIMQIAEVEDIEAVVLSLDFVKCFDKCSFSILHGSLEFFGFGEVVKKWTEIFYRDFVVKIQNNGFFSELIPIQKGVHQGGCCSSVYFLVMAEILAIALRSNEQIDGISFKDIKNILNQFADDMDIFSLCNEKSLRAITSELESFKRQSGFTLSYEKTTLYRIGSLRHSNACLYNISELNWSNQDITVLGVTIAHEDIVMKNYNEVTNKAKNILKAWYNRGLSLIGKVQVVNTLVASLFVYKMMVLPSIPKSVIKCVDSYIREFLWDGKKSKVAYRILQCPKKAGGLNLVNLEKRDTALKASWPYILKTEEEYAKIVYQLLRCEQLEQNIWRCNINSEDAKMFKTKSQFWRDVLFSWSQYNSTKNFRIENQIIWYNSYIKIANKLIMWNDVYKKGLLYVHQLFQNQEFKSHQQVWQEYGLTTLRYNSIKAAIPLEWKNFFYH